MGTNTRIEFSIVQEYTVKCVNVEFVSLYCLPTLASISYYLNISFRPWAYRHSYNYFVSFCFSGNIFFWANKNAQKCHPKNFFNIFNFFNNVWKKKKKNVKLTTIRLITLRSIRFYRLHAIKRMYRKIVLSWKQCKIA